MEKTPRSRLAAIADHWDGAAPSFDEAPDHGLLTDRTRAAWERRLRTWLPPASARVLDAGCGTGSLSLLMARAGHRVTGVDLAPRMVERARAKLAGAGERARFLVGDAAAPPTGDERFEVVLARHVLWTLPDPHEALRRWVARLSPGGRLVLVEGRWRCPSAGGTVPYAPGAGALPWGGGVGARTLEAAVRPYAASVRVEPLDGDPDLWGGPVEDERYALTARI